MKIRGLSKHILYGKKVGVLEDEISLIYYDNAVPGWKFCIKRNNNLDFQSYIVSRPIPRSPTK